MLIHAGAIYRKASTLGPQVFVPRKGDFDPERLRACGTVISNEYNNKPWCEEGLLWTSSLKDTSSEWLNWCKWDMPDWIGDVAVIFKVPADANIYTINSKEDYKRLMDRFPGNPNPIHSSTPGLQVLDWAEIAEHFDAVHVTGDLPPAMQGWAVESTVWFDPTKLVIDRTVLVEHKCSMPEWFDPDTDDPEDVSNYEMQREVNLKLSSHQRRALTPQQKEQKKDYLLEQAMKADCAIPSFKEIVEKHESLQWSLQDQEYSEYEATDPDDLIREDYDDEGIREMAEERVQKELDLLDDEIKEIDEKCRYERDDGRLNKCWEERDDLSYKRDKLVDKAVNHVWDDLREEYEEKVDRRVEDSVEERYEEFISEARDELDWADEGDVWRVVMVDHSVDPTKLSGIGRFWTRRKDLARPFLDFDEGERLKDAKAVRFHAKVDHEYVDVCDTLEANVWGKMTGNETDETEIRFYKHAPVYVYSVDVIDMDPNQPELYRGESEVLETLPIEGMRRC